jgi:hypothetical protein
VAAVAKLLGDPLQEIGDALLQLSEGELAQLIDALKARCIELCSSCANVNGREPSDEIPDEVIVDRRGKRGRSCCMRWADDRWVCGSCSWRGE